MTEIDRAREMRIAEVIGAVARQALADRGRTRIALLDDGGPEAELAARLLTAVLGVDAVERVSDGGDVESVLHAADGISPARRAEEARRTRARLMDGALPAHPASKTVLLLGGELPPEPLLPLGDLWASEVAALAGAWSAPGEIRALAEAAGGIDALDAALRGLIDGRDAAALDALPAGVRDAVRGRLAAGRASRIFPRVVPKLGSRTLGADLFE